MFRPIYTFDTTASNFTPRLQLSNVDTYSGNVVSVFRADVGDSASNVYVGSNSGNSFSNTRDCEKITALGVGAANGISDDSNSIYIGWYAGSGGSNSQDVISIGTESGEGNGSSNIFLGTETGTIGASNILIGHFINLPSVSNQIRIGYRDQIPIAADLSKNWVGLGGILNPTDIVYATTDISGSTRIQGNLGVNIAPGTRTLDVNGNFRSQDASGNVLDFADGLTRSSSGFASTRGSNVVFDSSIVSIGTLKRGIVIVAVNSGSDYHGLISFVLDTSGPTVSNLVSSNSVGTTVVFGSDSINISNTTGGTRSYDWSITYFPLP